MTLFTSKVEYALRALLDLTEQPSGRAAQSHEIACRQGIPEAYLNQLLVAMRRAGLVRSIRGASGGYVIGRGAASITVGDVMRAFHGENCFAEETAPRGSCPRDGGAAWVVRDLRRRVDAALRDLLEGTTLADLDAERRRLQDSQSLMLGI